MFFKTLLLITVLDHGGLSQLEVVCTARYPMFKPLAEDLRLYYDLIQVLRAELDLELSHENKVEIPIPMQKRSIMIKSAIVNSLPILL